MLYGQQLQIQDLNKRTLHECLSKDLKYVCNNKHSIILRVSALLLDTVTKQICDINHGRVKGFSTKQLTPPLSHVTVCQLSQFLNYFFRNDFYACVLEFVS